MVRLECNLYLIILHTAMMKDVALRALGLLARIFIILIQPVSTLIVTKDSRGACDKAVFELCSANDSEAYTSSFLRSIYCNTLAATYV